MESSKSASDIYCPVTGDVIEVNSALNSEPELINRSCYEQGWICKLKVTDAKSIEELMNSKQYEEFLNEL